MSAAIWYCDIDGKQLGPMSPYDLKELADAGKLQVEHLIWKEGMQTKLPARSVRGLFGGPAPSPPTASKPQTVDSPPPTTAKAPIPAPPPPAKTQVAAAPAKTQIADVATEPMTWVEKPPAPLPSPKKEEDVVETQVAEDVVDTQVAEDVVDTQPAEDVVTTMEAVEPVAPAAGAKKKSRVQVDREPKDLRDALTLIPEKGAVPPPAPPVAGKPFRVLCAGQILGPFSLVEIRRQLAAGRFTGTDLIGIETWLPVATLGDLLLENLIGKIPFVPASPASPIAPAAHRPKSAPVVPAMESDDLVPTMAENDLAQEEDLVSAEADIKDEDIPISQIEEIEDSKPEPVKKPDLPKSDTDSIPVDEEFNL